MKDLIDLDELQDNVLIAEKNGLFFEPVTVQHLLDLLTAEMERNFYLLNKVEELEKKVYGY